MKKTLFISVAIIALLVQILFPVWWVAVLASFFSFWNEGIIEGGILMGSFTFSQMFFGAI